MPAIVAQAAAVAEHDHQGIIAYRIHQVGAMDGGPIHHRTDVLMMVIADGEKIVRVRVLRFQEDGSEQSDERKAQLATDLLAGQAGGGFAVPFDRRHLAEYSYASANDSVAFTSRVRDADHGDGSFQVDGGGHVTRMTYVPDALPKFAATGRVIVERAEALPGFWATLRSQSTFSGSILLIRGTASTVTEMDDYRRFATLADAERALDANR
jgi:hypothetical protein